MQPGVYVTAPAAAGSGIPSTGGTPYTAIQYDAAGVAQYVDYFTDSLGVVSLKFDQRVLTDSNAFNIFYWNIPDTLGMVAVHINMGLQNYATNAAALAGGLISGDLYQTAGVVKIVL